ncbi:prepilin peptidase [Saccharopolyspora sp. NPDC047091]|uniref:prepilin peptidase n=1 Tax=Saccharopolyspora sp. NPDC047091 TaxID=3155924 RepID=UPI0034111559
MDLTSGIAHLIGTAFAAGALGAVAGRAGRALLRTARIGIAVPRWCCAAGTALLWAPVAVRAVAGALPVWWAPVPLLLGWAGVLLAACDLRAHRLPDALTLPAWPLAFAAVAGAAGAAADAVMLVSSFLGAALFAGCYGLVRMLSPPALGPGDVKLAGPLGALVGAVSVPAVLGCVLVSAVLTVLHACAARRRAVPHGPAMLLPAWLVTAVGPVPGSG